MLWLAALERIGDTYGIYCFAGTGREHVKFHVLKDMDENLSDSVAARFDRIRPLRGMCDGLANELIGDVAQLAARLMKLHRGLAG